MGFYSGVIVKFSLVIIVKNYIYFIFFYKCIKIDIKYKWY